MKRMTGACDPGKSLRQGCAIISWAIPLAHIVRARDHVGTCLLNSESFLGHAVRSCAIRS